MRSTLHKGDRVLVFGRLVTRVYTPQSGEHAGQVVRKLEVVVDEMGQGQAGPDSRIAAGDGGQEEGRSPEAVSGHANRDR